ncbi:hypothetical protein [Xanthobacter sediminis]
MSASPKLPKLPAVGDWVRCVTDAAWDSAFFGPFPLVVGRVYQVRAVTPDDSGLGGAVYVHGFPNGFIPERFDTHARAAANDDPCDAVVIPRRMAQVMREQVAAGGACTVDDLARAGFTAAQILEYADEARGIAGPVPVMPGEVA